MPNQWAEFIALSPGGNKVGLEGNKLELEVGKAKAGEQSPGAGAERPARLSTWAWGLR